MGNQAYAKPTADGRVWARADELVGTTFCIPKENGLDADYLSAGCGENYRNFIVTKGSTGQKTAGWHKAGEAFL